MTTDNPKSAEIDANAFARTDPEAALLLAQRGIVQERARVAAFLDLGQSCHAPERALECIRAGEAISATSTGKFLVAAMNHADRYRRQRESDLAHGTLDGVDGAPSGATDLGARVVSRLSPAAPSSFVRP